MNRREWRVLLLSLAVAGGLFGCAGEAGHRLPGGSPPGLGVLALEGASLRLFDPVRGTWEPLEAGANLAAGDEVIAGHTLFRVAPHGALEPQPSIDVDRLAAATAVWSPDAPDTRPALDDVVWLLGEVPRHIPLRSVEQGQQFAFHGRIWAAKRQAGKLGIRPTGKTLDRIADVAVRRVDRVVDVAVVYEDSQQAAVITGTPDHPVYVPSLGAFLPIDAIAPGTTLATPTGARARVERKEDKMGAFEVHNLEVAEAHTFFVGDTSPELGGVLVHNSRKCGEAKSREIVDNAGSFHEARLKAKEMAGITDVDDLVPHYADMGPLDGQVTGMMTPDGARGWRIDFDPGNPDKGFHVNWWDHSADIKKRDKSKLRYGAVTVPGYSYSHFQDIFSHFPKN